MSNVSSDPPAVAKTNKQSNVPRVPWNPWLALIFIIVLYYGSQFISSIVLIMYTTLRGMSGSEASAYIDGSTFLQFFYIALTEALIIGGIYWFLRMSRVGFDKIGLTKPRIKDVGIGLLAVPVYFAVYLLSVALISHFVPSLNVNQEQQIGFDNVHGIVALTLTFISLVILPPITEEIMVRGFMYSTFKKIMPTLGAVLVTSAIFASAHLPEGGASGPLYIAALDTFVLSLILIYLREKTGGLWASITLHGMKNGVAFIALFALHLK